MLKAHCAPALHWELGGDSDEKKQTQAIPFTFIIFEKFHSKKKIKNIYTSSFSSWKLQSHGKEAIDNYTIINTFVIRSYA